MDVMMYFIFLTVLITAITADMSEWTRCRRNGDFSSHSLQQMFEPTINRSVLCDTETDGGGWIIFQRRVIGDWSFYRGWDAYVKGFGALSSDHWLGLDHVHRLTSH
ncbi:hypothetical protein EGW08_023426, partial [Elysia chlorotica]